MNVIKQGVQEQLRQGVNPNKIIYEGSGGNIKTGRANVRGAVKSIINSMGAVSPSSITDYMEQKVKLNPQDWLENYMKKTDPLLITPGVGSQFKEI